ncbi:hypothetical protein Ancab_000055 [Ancistrocladus abbreviatus]
MGSQSNRNNLFLQALNSDATNGNGPFHSQGSSNPCQGTNPFSAHHNIDYVADFPSNPIHNINSQNQFGHMVGQLALNQRTTKARAQTPHASHSICVHSMTQTYPMQPQPTIVNINVGNTGQPIILNFNVGNNAPATISNTENSPNSPFSVITNNHLFAFTHQHTSSSNATVSTENLSSALSLYNHPPTSNPFQDILAPNPNQGHLTSPRKNTHVKKHGLSQNGLYLNSLNQVHKLFPHNGRNGNKLVQNCERNTQTNRNSENDDNEQMDDENGVLDSVPPSIPILESNLLIPKAPFRIHQRKTLGSNQGIASKPTITAPESHNPTPLQASCLDDHEPESAIDVALTSKRPARRENHVVKNRSNPQVKNGSYTCPKCEKKLETKQLIAAHMSKHYKNEKLEEQRKRREAKCRKRDLHVVHSTEGLTVVPKKLRLEKGLYHLSETPKDKVDQEDVPSRVKIKEEAQG